MKNFTIARGYRRSAERSARKSSVTVNLLPRKPFLKSSPSPGAKDNSQPPSLAALLPSTRQISLKLSCTHKILDLHLAQSGLTTPPMLEHSQLPMNTQLPQRVAGQAPDRQSWILLLTDPRLMHGDIAQIGAPLSHLVKDCQAASEP